MALSWMEDESGEREEEYVYPCMTERGYTHTHTHTYITLQEPKAEKGEKR